MAAITPAYGYESYIQIGRESTWKTAVAATHKFGVYELEVTPKLATYQGRALVGGISKSTMNQGVVTYDIRILMSMSYDFLGQFWDGVMGTTTFGTTGGSVSGSGPYTHTFIEKTVINSYTVECIEGNRGAAGVTGKCNRYYGCKIKSIKIHGEATPAEGSNCTLEVIFSAPSVTTEFTVTPGLNTATDSPCYFYQATTVDDGTSDAFSADGLTNQIMKSFDLTVDLNMAERYMMGLASMFEPQRTGFVSTNFSCVKEMQTSSLFVAATAFTSGSPKLVFNNGLSAGANRQYTFDIGTAKIITYSNPITNSGIVEQNVTWDALYDSGNTSGLKIINISGQATILTAA